MKIIKLVITTILISILILNFIPSMQFAFQMLPSTDGPSRPKVDTTIEPEDYKPGKISTSEYWGVTTKAATLLNAIIIVGTVISVVMFTVLGIKYMLGSVEERADYKKTMLPMLIGTLMLFCTTTIVGIIGKLMQNFD